VQLASFEPAATALYLGRYAFTAFLFAFAHLGLVLGISQLTRSVPWSRALGLLGLVFAFGVHGWLVRTHWRASAPALFDTVDQLFPAAHRMDLWQVAWGDVAPGALMLVSLGIALFALGHVRFLRRDA